MVYKEAQGKLGELEARIQMLEDENIAQRHMIQLGELRKQKETEDMRKYHTRLIYELEQEKKKLEEEIYQVLNMHELKFHRVNSIQTLLYVHVDNAKGLINALISNRKS